MPLLNLIALYNYDNSIFQDLELPTGIDKDACVDLFLTETSDFNMIYPNPEFFKARLASWNKRRLPIWRKLWGTTQYEYDPIANYDRTETHTETVTHTGTDSTQRTDQMTHTGTDGTQTSETATHTGTVANQNAATDTVKRTGYNSDALQTTEQTEHTGNSTDTNNLTDSAAGTATRTVNLADNSTGSETLTRNLQDSVSRSIRAYGNIGVTTTQQMIEAERESVKFDMYRVICDDFIDAFCVFTY